MHKQVCPFQVSTHSGTLAAVTHFRESHVLVQAHTKVEETTQRECGGDAKQEEDKWTDNRIEDDSGKGVHDGVHEVKSFLRIKGSLGLDTAENIPTVSLQVFAHTKVTILHNTLQLVLTICLFMSIDSAARNTDI